MARFSIVWSMLLWILFIWALRGMPDEFHKVSGITATWILISILTLAFFDINKSVYCIYKTKFRISNTISAVISLLLIVLILIFIYIPLAGGV